MTLDGNNLAQQPDAEQARPIAPRIPRILVAEDDDELRSLLCQALGQSGYDVVSVSDGLELMEHLSSYLGPTPRARVDLIVSDIRMPWVNGLEVLRSVKQHVGYPKTILITAFGDDEVHAEARRLGAAAILDKPFDLADLLAKISDNLSTEPQQMRLRDASVSGGQPRTGETR